MQTKGIASSLRILTLLALVGGASAANATVIIKSFQFKICVTGAKHPDGCKHADADAHLVVSDDAMERFDGAIGQGASIEALPDRGAVPSADVQKHRRHQQ